MAYTGTKKGGVPHGQGILTFKNGEQYEGDFINGRREGKGTYKFSDGRVYVGDWVDNNLQGTGKMTFPNGRTYVGSFIDGQMTGKGKMTFPNGDYYEGDFVQGLFHGKGKYFRTTDNALYEGELADNKKNGIGSLSYYSHNGKVLEERYTGSWKDDKKEGQGELIFRDGRKYEGEFSNDQMHGQGTFTYTNGSVYKGSFENGLRCGKGLLVYNTGRKYDGHWRNNLPHGQGLFVYPTGDVYEGSWIASKRQGQGKFTYTNGDVYQGEWTEGEATGKGVFNFSNGDVFVGSFKIGNPFGEGTLTSIDGNKLVGVWDGMNGEGSIEFHRNNLVSNNSVFRGVISGNNNNISNNTIGGGGGGSDVIILQHCKWQRQANGNIVYVNLMQKTIDRKELLLAMGGGEKNNNNNTQGEGGGGNNDTIGGGGGVLSCVVNEDKEIKTQSPVKNAIALFDQKKQKNKKGIEKEKEEEKGEEKKNGGKDKPPLSSSSSTRSSLEQRTDQEALIDPKSLEEVSKLGSGGFGEVFRGYFHGGDCAWKTLSMKLNQDMIKEFNHEVYLMSKLRHPNVIAFYGYTASPDHRIVMEYANRRTLHHHLHESRSKADIPLVVDFAYQIAAGMSYLHSLKIIHKDLKPLNVLLKDDIGGALRCKIADFGLSKFRTNSQTMVVQKGTALYSPPEGFSSGKVSDRVDVFSFGMIMWEMWNREVPFSRCTMNQIVQNICTGVRPPIPLVPPEYPYMHRYSTLMQRCWSHHPKERPSFKSILEEMKNIKNSMTAASHSSNPPPTPPLTGGRSKLGFKHKK